MLCIAKPQAVRWVFPMLYPLSPIPYPLLPITYYLLLVFFVGFFEQFQLFGDQNVVGFQFDGALLIFQRVFIIALGIIHARQSVVQIARVRLELQGFLRVFQGLIEVSLGVGHQPGEFIVVIIDFRFGGDLH